MGNTYEDFFSKYQKALIEKAQKELEKAIDKTYKEFFKLVDEKLKKMHIESVDDFYDKYDPKYYSRRKSLYNIYRSTICDDYFQYDFDPSKIESRTGYNEEDGLYDTVFRKGYHGGANLKDNGVYKIPKLNPKFSAEFGHLPIDYDGDDNKPWEIERPTIWINAKQSESPLNIFNEKLKKYLEKEYQEDFNKIWNKNVKNIKL